MTTTRLYRDSVGVLTLKQSDSTRTVTSVPMPTAPIPFGGSAGSLIPVRPSGSTVVVGAGLLTSGIASMQRTLDAFNAGTAATYRDIIAMTKLDGWK